MNILGLITEYNPFHNGHLHHLEESKELSKATHTIAVMSGHFVQRGEPAIFDKWTRAAMAVNSGVDLVIELPTVFAVSSAEYFAFGSIDLLNRLGLVTDLAFGSESGHIDDFCQVSQIFVEDSVALDEKIRGYLSTGMSYPSARQMALSDMIPNHQSHLTELVSSPNNILGIEYLKALHTVGSSIRPHTIPRISSDYNSVALQGAISSATAIRKHLQDFRPDCDLASTASDTAIFQGFDYQSALQTLLPDSALEQLLSNDENHPNCVLPIFPEALSQMLLYRLRSMSALDLALIHDVKEGLQNSIKSHANTAGTWETLLTSIKSKRYPRTRLQRIMIKALLGISDDFVGRTGQLRAEYARVLAFNDQGRELLATMKKTATIPIITRPGKAPMDERASQMLAYDILASDLYALLCPNQDNRKGGRDFSQPPIYIR